jgi:predicted transcriptional regulator
LKSILVRKLIMLKIDLRSFFTTSVRILVTVCFCTIIFASNSVPAFAAISSPDEGTAKLNEIQKRTDNLTKNTDDIAKQDRSVPPSLKEVQSASKKGINEIQGDADKDKMISPEDAKNATTVEDSIKKAFSKVKGDK